MKGEGYIKYKGEAMTLSFKYYPRQLNSVENPSQTSGPGENHLLPHSLCLFHSFLSFQHLQQDHFSMQISSAFSENSIFTLFPHIKPLAFSLLPTNTHTEYTSPQTSVHAEVRGGFKTTPGQLFKEIIL